MPNISTFELLVKPIAPIASIPVPFEEVGRRVVQGYFLTITNLSFFEDVVFRFDFRSSAPQPDDLNRRLSLGNVDRNVDLIYDIAGNNLPLDDLSFLDLTFFNWTYVIRGSLNLPTRQTATVQLLPRLTQQLLSDPNPNFEIRGFVRVSILRNSEINNEITVDQIPVLLQPEIRGTFLPNDFSDPNLDFDQINYSLVPASGQAENLIDVIDIPDPFGGLSITNDSVTEILKNIESGSFPIENFSDADQLNQLTRLFADIAAIEPTTENLSRISDLLRSRRNTPLATQRR